MAFDKATRNALAKMVGECRRLLTDDIRGQLQAVYGLQPDGSALPVSRLGHLDEPGCEVARELREWQQHLASTEIGTEADRNANAFTRMAGETAFTVLNRLAALRMCEEREHVVECVRRGMESDGFQLYERLLNGALGTRPATYRVFLERMFDELAVDLGVLFALDIPQSLVFPSELCLEQVLAELNAPSLAHLWKEDETIGWVYQYFNSKEEREAMREASAAPRNSRELAVRNQFFTPRYVVEFLVDNTLGRIWYEMRKGDTALKETCRYLVRRPTEIFLNEGEEAPAYPDNTENLSQGELLKQPAYIPHRPKKDPRDLKVLDPACGSGHFLLYAFDLLETIYEEAWSDERQVASESKHKPLQEIYPDVASLKRVLPALILTYNVHGIDIDLRACQIAALALWLRAQRSYQRLRLKPADRPIIERSNIVCAEPMPGERELLDQFVVDLQPKVLGQLIQAVFEKMKLAGEAGSLLRIEDEIAGVVAEAKKLWLAGPQAEQGRLFLEDNRPEQAELDLDLSGITDETFWDRVEDRIYLELKHYAEQAANGQGYQRRLFTSDAARGFAFIDLCKQRYEVVVMNPPFGDTSLPSKPYVDEVYSDTKGDVYKAFVECAQSRMVSAGYLGIISSRTGFFLGLSEDWRTRVVLRLFRPITLVDLGSDVLDAMVEVAAYVLRSLSFKEARDLTHSIVPTLRVVDLDSQGRFTIPKWQVVRSEIKRHQAIAELGQLESAGFVRRSKGETLRYVPVWGAVDEVTPVPAVVFPKFVCIRMLQNEDKGTALENEINTPSRHCTFVCDPAGFGDLPGSTFAYWVGASIRRVFSTFPPFKDGSGRNACMTNPAGDDTRYFRASWEVPPALIGRQIRWVPITKGGAFSRFYSDVHLLADWDPANECYRGFLGTIHRPLRKPASLDVFFRPALTWPRRTTSGLSVRALPAGCLFADKGPVAIVPDDDPKSLLSLLAITNSRIFEGLVSLQLAAADSAARSYEVGLIQRTPLPTMNDGDVELLAKSSYGAWLARCALDTAEENSHAFWLPSLIAMPGETLFARSRAWAEAVDLAEKSITSRESEINQIATRLYGLTDVDVSALTSSAAVQELPDSVEIEEQKSASDAKGLAGGLVSYIAGVAFGRWDVRCSTGDVSVPAPPGPFEPLAVCAPGLLRNELGLPITESDEHRLRTAGKWHYPIEIAWDGLLVDDDENVNDLVSRVREVLNIIWKEQAEAVEHEACELLQAKDLREYFRKPALFFFDHLKRYSKSRRQAPIYWPLSTASGSYTLWLYYHRLNNDTVFGAVNRYVKPKIQDTEREIRQLESELTKAMGREASKLRAGLEAATALLSELGDFEAELLRVAALPYKPNLNDGVLITAAPLWKLFRLPKWRKDLEECWKQLQAGEFDWAHMAMNIWPDRVREKCRKDRSIAIAHDLENLYEQSAQPKAKRPARHSVHIGIE